MLCGWLILGGNMTLKSIDLHPFSMTFFFHLKPIGLLKGKCPTRGMLLDHYPPVKVNCGD